ncbi:YajG family lipoprotein [Saccharospirillum salsuginis]|uniref:Lipoprotein n=1 Tax=Saccharospirillum salsuginis TaxID=418750 RepID=A0A918KS66_9GAMM|nr:YajG family lipoprotein [Saccharospirillum salsuginis]GGX74018.1 hypothetical protein GCM10007392_46740 [Saccharospirillum salsuginis]
MNRLTRAALAGAMTLLLAGCAQLSPQQVTFEPDVPESSIQGDGSTLWVDVEDNRPSNVIGQRGGVYEDSSDITPAGNLRELLRTTAEETLREAGYELVEMNPRIEFTLSLDELNYAVEDVDAARKEATASAKISIQAVKGGTIYSNAFRSQRTIETLRFPSPEENSEILNHVFNAVVERALTDPGLQAFLNE